jgi:hypothetical protein
MDINLQSCPKAVLVTLLVCPVLAACGAKQKPGPPRQSTTAQIEQVSRQWNEPDSDKPSGAVKASSTPRERIANRLIWKNDLLPLGAPQAAVTTLLGPPETSTARIWSYVASRRRPADGFGGWCERRFEVKFDIHGRVTEETLRQPVCPRDSNP